MLTAYSEILNTPAQNLNSVATQSIDLIVTSPPYPMVKMWDDCFCAQNPNISSAIEQENWALAYAEMNSVLNRAWDECDRVLKDNRFICINIGDATRTCDGDFRLFPNHSAVIRYFENKGYSVLPDIHWRKPSNSPNKFMGSGMYPAGAYVTYEHEYILIFRKGGKRIFKGNDILHRRQSAYFWEERNQWFSDLWEMKGTAQAIKNCTSRKRSAAFPLEIPYRLINMYSIYGDTVLDPFGGLGTTAFACAASLRNCIISDIDADMCQRIRSNLLKVAVSANQIISDRANRHLQFISSLSEEQLSKCYQNKTHKFMVKTRQEMDLSLYSISKVRSLSEYKLLFEYEPLLLNLND